ncbi:MAG: Gfo/Idh/MocA family oxidoreductase, partial [Clostridia bacterium]|nr:Gfo/Idh/MocA family oxidoreductase [Clostridia bacterium]
GITMSGTFSWAFIGTGTLAKQVAKEIASSGRHRIAAVYSRNEQKREAFARQYGAFAAPNAEAAITHPDVDAVYIVTPHTSHAEYALQAIGLGKPVLCEKPITTDAAQAREMIRLSREKGIYFTEAMWTWFSPIANQVKKWLDDGEYGEIKSLHFTYHIKSINYAPRVSDPMLAGGALLDIGIYPLTYIYRLFGKPERIECQGVLKNGIDTDNEIRLFYPGGKAYTASVSLLDFKGLEKMTLKGTEGHTNLRFYHMANQVKLCRLHGKNETLRAYGGMLNEFDLVASEIRAGLTESAYVPHQATLDVMELMDECRRQMGLVYPFEKAAPGEG